MLCVECGEEVQTEAEALGGLCVRCFLERNPPLRVPEMVDVVMCPRCGAMKTGSTWRGPEAVLDEDDELALTRRAIVERVEGCLSVVEGALLRTLEVIIEPESRNHYHVQLLAQVELCGHVTDAAGTTTARLRSEVCQVCSRRAGQYYESIVQVRGTRGRPASEEELAAAGRTVDGEVERMARASGDVYVVKAERMHGGLDFYISTQSAGAQVARALCNAFGAEETTSTSTAGRRDGRDMVRVTHAVRLPELRRGDLVTLDGELLRVESVTSKEALVVPAAGEGRRRRVTRDERSNLSLAGTADDVEEAVVVSVSGPDLQVLDPITLGTVELRAPRGYDPSGRETVRVLRREGELLLVD